MASKNDLSKLVSISDTGRVTLTDDNLEALVSSSELEIAGGSGSVNESCTNSGDCSGTINTTSCTNTSVCDGSLNGAKQCTNPRNLEG